MSNHAVKTGKVYLVGAGPGDPGLITLKGLECIKEADVLVYDRLANPVLLDYAPGEAEHIYVGKLPDRHTLPQEKINVLLVEKALEGKTVTRLKGGDPFVFGRGGEEAELLAKEGIAFEVIPGITSAIAVPAYAGIPVTHRDFTSTLAIITGHEDPTKGSTDIDWAKISTGIGTLVFLMGIANLSSIVEKLLEYGRGPSTPVALIRWGTLSEQQTLVGTLDNISLKAREINFKPPAIIIVGEVVSLRTNLQWFEKRPLWGKRVVVTRSREQASQLSEKIRSLGGEPVEFPTIQVVPPSDYRPLDEAINKIEDYRWLIFTSVNGVKHFFERLSILQKDIRNLQGIHLCAIGPKTKESLEEKYLKVEYVPSEYRAEAIIKQLKGKVKAGEKVLLPRADIARKDLSQSLQQMGAMVDDVVAYKTIRGKGNAELLRQDLRDGLISLVTFTSSSTVKNFVELLGEENIKDLLKGVSLASIGPITTKTAEDMGLHIDIEAEEYTIDGLVNAILARASGKGGIQGD